MQLQIGWLDQVTLGVMEQRQMLVIAETALVDRSRGFVEAFSVLVLVNADNWAVDDESTVIPDSLNELTVVLIAVFLIQIVIKVGLFFL